MYKRLQKRGEKKSKTDCVRAERGKDGNGVCRWFNKKSYEAREEEEEWGSEKREAVKLADEDNE